MCDRPLNCRQLAATIAAIVLTITAFLGFDRPSTLGGKVEIGLRAGTTSEVRIAAEVQVTWTTYSEGHRT